MLSFVSCFSKIKQRNQLEESWQSNQGRNCLYETEAHALEQQRAFQQDMTERQEQLDGQKKQLLHKRVQTEATLEQLKRDVRT